MGLRKALLAHGKRLRSLIVAGVAIATTLTSSQVFCEPFIPQSDETIVERLPAVAAPFYRELQDLLAAPANLDASVGLARKYIRLAKQESDPRYYGYAQGALARWWNDPSPPVTVLTPRAMIKQSRHDFEGALAIWTARCRPSPSICRLALDRLATDRLALDRLAPDSSAPYRSAKYRLASKGGPDRLAL